MKKYALVVLLLLPFVGMGQIITTYAGGGTGGDGGPATDAQLGLDRSIATDKLGNLYIVDANSVIRKVDAITGIISTIAGNGTTGFIGDGGQATDAEFSFALAGAVAIDNIGNICISDEGNYRIRKVNVATGIIKTVAGNGVNLNLGNGGPATAASFAAPGAMSFDKLGNLYVEDSLTWVRKIDTNGMITNYAGNGILGYTGDGGGATTAAIICGGGLTCDMNNNLLISSATRIRKVNFATGIISTIAGNGSSSAYADSVPAISSSVIGWFFIVDPIGQIYLSEYSGTENKIRKIDTSGYIYTIAGIGTFGFSGDGGPATACQLAYPGGLAFDPCGNLYVADEQNARVRKVTISSHPFISLSGNVFATIGTTVSVTADVANAGTIYSIKWYNHGTLFATTSVPSVTYTKTMAVDSITAKVNSSSCGGADSSISVVHVVTNAHVSVPEPQALDNIQLFPNPAHTELHIQSPTELQTITITNLLGQVVYTGEYNDKQATINIEKLQSGVYFVRCNPAFSAGVNGWLVGKLIKE